MAASATAMAKAKEKKYDWKNRIVRHGERPASEFVLNDKNWRTHNGLQRKAMNGVLAEVGWVQAVLVNANSGRVIDGHMRIEEALRKGAETSVPFVEVDLSDDEERKILAVFDPIGALAGEDAERFQDLVESISSESADLNEFLTHLTEHLQVPEFREYDESVESTVEFNQCPKCEHRWPK